MLGLGKLGLPVATALAARGIDVWGHDPFVDDFPQDLSYEADFAETVKRGDGRVHFMRGPGEVLDRIDGVCLIAVQTPHEARFEGVTPLPDDRADFDYSFLIDAVRDANELSTRPTTFAVISTVLPGTMEREIIPLLKPGNRLCYTPQFIAMSTTIEDFLHPEFVLLGGDTGEVEAVYKAAGIGPFYRTTVPNAELIKVAYNTFIGLKLAFANTLMEVCHKTACDVDEVTNALALAKRRLISPAYMQGGMGDGGGCHPRDNIALSWLARELALSHDLFEDAMVARENQTQWLVDLVSEKCAEHNLPPAILGLAYKPGSHITTGSPARLAFSQLMKERFALHGGCDIFDPHVTAPQVIRSKPTVPAVFLVGCRHPEFPEWELPEGSVVIDPWRYMPDRDGIEVHRIGATNEQSRIRSRAVAGEGSRATQSA